jgi:cytochrome o ubiquinol oxidase operon protein cyoD
MRYEEASNIETQFESGAQERKEFRFYVWGIALALLLTVVPFALVQWRAMPRGSMLIVIGVFALAQILVHFRFFLHIGFKQKREDLQLIVFSALLLTIMVAGTIWIMTSLALRMAMPGQP